jgi:hypothetical protein
MAIPFLILGGMGLLAAAGVGVSISESEKSKRGEKIRAAKETVGEMIDEVKTFVQAGSFHSALKALQDGEVYLMKNYDLSPEHKEMFKGNYAALEKLL